MVISRRLLFCLLLCACVLEYSLQSVLKLPVMFVNAYRLNRCNPKRLQLLLNRSPLRHYYMLPHLSRRDTTRRCATQITLKNAAQQLLVNKTSQMKVISFLSEISTEEEGLPLLGTHDGKFHCDEVLGMVLLKSLPEYRDAIIVRTRRPEILSNCTVVIDVGDKFDVQSQRYDHHHRDFCEYFDENHHTTKLSSCGLVYKFYGKGFLRLCGFTHPQDLEWSFQKLYDCFLEGIDANDNGVSISDTPQRYKVSTSLPNRVNRLNSKWNEVNPDQNGQFIKAFQVVKEELNDQIQDLLLDLQAKTIVLEALENRFQTHPSGQLIYLQSSCPFQNFVLEYEKEITTTDTPILFALYQSKDTLEWHLRSINEGDSFLIRKPFPSHLCGLRETELATAAAPYGLSNLTFIHKSGFLAISKTKEAALQLFAYVMGC